MIAKLQADLDTIVASTLFDSISVMSPSDRTRSRGRNPKYSQEQILRILVLKEILHLSFRDVVRKLYLNDSYRKLCLLKRDSIPSASTLSYRQSLEDFHVLIQKTVMLYEMSSRAPQFNAVDSTMVKPCLDHRARLQRKTGKYKDKNASWTKTTKDKWEYGYKAHISCDTESSMVLEYSFATAKEHDSTHFEDLVGSLRNSRYIFCDKAYDSKKVYDMILERTSAIPVVDVNPRRGSSGPSNKDSLNRWIRKNLRVRYAHLYKRRWEIERVNANLKSIFFYSLEHIFYVPNRHYEKAVGLKLLTHNLVILANILNGLPNNRKLVL